MAFRNLGPSVHLTAMEGGFADILQDNLGAVKNVRLVEREKLREVLAEQKLSIAGLADPATAVRVGRILGAQRLVYGSFIEMGEELRLDVRLADSQTAAVLAAETAQGKTAEFAALLEGLPCARPRPGRPARRRRRLAARGGHHDAEHRGRHPPRRRRQGVRGGPVLAAAAAAYERPPGRTQETFPSACATPKPIASARRWRRSKPASRRWPPGSRSRPLGPGEQWGSPRTDFVGASWFPTRATENRGDAVTAFCHRIIEECPSAGIVAWARDTLAHRSLASSGGISEGEALLRDAVEAARKKNNTQQYSDRSTRCTTTTSLRKAASRPWAGPKTRRPNGPRRPTISWRWRCMYTQTHHQDAWRRWGYVLWNRGKNLKDPKARYETLKRVVTEFAWASNVCWDASISLAAACEETERWDEALETHRYVVAHPGLGVDPIAPDPWDANLLVPDTVFDATVRSLYSIGRNPTGPSQTAGGSGPHLSGSRGAVWAGPSRRPTDGRRPARAWEGAGCRRRASWSGEAETRPA